MQAIQQFLFKIWNIYYTLFLSVFIRWIMEEPGEQCTVVFALIVTEPTSEWVYGRGCYTHTPLAPAVCA